MNLAAHRLIFNPHRGQFMPVAEIARSHGKGRRTGRSGKAAQQTRADYKETHKKTGVSLGDLTGLFTPGEGVGFKSTLTTDDSQTRVAPTTLDAQNIAIQSHAGDLTLNAVQATAHGAQDANGSHQPGTLSLDAAHNLNLTSLTTTRQHSTDLKKKDLAWQSVGGNGSIDQTTHTTQLNAAQLKLSAGNRITADMSVKASAAILASEPGMGWLKQLQTDPNLNNKIDWNKIEQAHQNWHYKQQGLTPAAAAVIAIVVVFLTAGAGTAAVGTTATTAAGATTTTLAGTTLATTAGVGAATVYTTAGVLINTAVTTLASKAAVSLINNGGKLDATLKELGSSDNLKQLATSLVTAGLLSEIGQYNFGTTDHPFTLDSVTAKNSFAANVGKNLITGLTRATITSAVTGTDLETSLRTEVIASVLNAASAQGADWIGTQAQNNNLNAFSHAFAHAVAGCAAGAAGASAAGASAPGSGISGGSGCGAGALGAAVGELSAGFYNHGREAAGLPPKTDTVQFASMISGIAAALTGQSAQGVAIASGAGANAAQNNWLSHADAEQLKRLKQKQQDGQCGPTCEKSIAGLEILDKLNNRLLLNACVNGTAAECQAQVERDPAALQYRTQHIGIILGGRILSRAPDNADKALASLSQALAKTQIKPLVDAQGVITGWAVDLGGADPDTLRYWLGAGVYVGTIILPTNAIDFVPGLGKGLKVVTRGSERVVVEEASGKVLGKIGDASKVAPGGGLAAHEYAGGHLIDRHVGLAESDLATRLASDPKIQVASTFTDRATAEAAVSTVLDSNTVAIQNFLSGSATKPLVLNGSLPNPVGISLSRGATNSVPVSSVTVVLLRDASMPTGYRILTGYPKP